MSFLTPAAGLIALAGLVPLALVAVVDRRNARTRTALGLDAPSRGTRLELPVAVALLAVALGLAAAQPVLRTHRDRLTRTDAEAFVAVDTSRSMLASPSRSAPIRLDRARRIGEQIRAALPEVPTGIGTFTDRPLPLLLPTPDIDSFDAVANQSLAIEKPPGLQNGTTISSFDAVAPFPLEGYFAPKATHRVLIVITDAESEGFNVAGVRSSFQEKPRTSVVLIRVGREGEHVYDPNGQIEAAYIPPPATGHALKEFLDATHGRAFGEHDVAGAVQAARQMLGRGPEVRLGTASGHRALAPWLVLACVLPLGLVIRRRNL
jgi:hypothetical protein